MQKKGGGVRGEKLKIAIFDELPIFLAGLEACLNKEFEVEVILQADANLKLDGSIKAVVVGLTINNLEKAFELIERLDRSHTRVIAVVSNSCKEYLSELIQFDFDGYVCRTIPANVFVQAIKSVCEGKKFIDKQIAPLMLNLVKAKNLYKKLTEREAEVLNFFLKGLPPKKISRELFISERTVRFHLKNIYQKFGVANKHELKNILGNLITPNKPDKF